MLEENMNIDGRFFFKIKKKIAVCLTVKTGLDEVKIRILIILKRKI